VLFLRKHVWSAIRPKKFTDDSNAARILVELDDETKKMTVLKLGDLENDLNAWEGEDDPFVHLSAVERQEKLKTMRVRDIEHAGRRERNKNGKKKRRAEKRKDFKKPE
jgi:cold shock CspA family protein